MELCRPIKIECDSEAKQINLFKKMRDFFVSQGVTSEDGSIKRITKYDMKAVSNAIITDSVDKVVEIN
jgi:hypothetical protein